MCERCYAIVVVINRNVMCIQYVVKHNLVLVVVFWSVDIWFHLWFL